MPLTSELNTPERPAKTRSMGVFAGVKIFKGAMVINAGGFAAPVGTGGAQAINYRCLGRAAETVDATASTVNGELKITVEAGVFLYANKADDALTRADINGLAYAKDDATVGKSQGADGSMAGLVFDVDESGAWIRFD
ncbi:hypothetical protein [Labrys neptuniae]|uniref:DUF2190 family protein n=1 Tax=Labrys neptuniae TaxID=376174 RepID=A0ABV3PGH3_9HYPH